ncbi:hypothetical protein EDC61_1232 [Sulfuritortus calidifontis]|uniref:Uncharacterized protein n=1 Tax=Sulfuritortus calidifontis TaxID=1914471 RepID=A0A4R3JSM0_9PROT|nr:hypothetical protein [Sulfuritortus calidifontis]TCS68787.1 hypothetical protein EDC61_1232 [Sulfuritortus calidifontis]
MIRLSQALAAWGTETFRHALKQEIEALDARLLPLQQGLTRGSHALEGRHEAVPLGAADLGEKLQAKVGLFYASVIAGCSCADDPTPVGEETEYCVLQLDIDKRTAETTVSLLAE